MLLRMRYTMTNLKNVLLQISGWHYHSCISCLHSSYIRPELRNIGNWKAVRSCLSACVGIFRVFTWLPRLPEEMMAFDASGRLEELAWHGSGEAMRWCYEVLCGHVAHLPPSYGRTESFERGGAELLSFSSTPALMSSSRLSDSNESIKSCYGILSSFIFPSILHKDPHPLAARRCRCRAIDVSCRAVWHGQS